MISVLTIRPSAEQREATLSVSLCLCFGFGVKVWESVFPAWL